MPPSGPPSAGFELGLSRPAAAQRTVAFAARAPASIRSSTACSSATLSSSIWLWPMDWPDYLRDQAAMYRRLAEQADDPVVKNELLELAPVCEEVATEDQHPDH